MEQSLQNEAYEKYAVEYDRWFDMHTNFYYSELAAIRNAIPDNKKGIEIGVGSGRFAAQLGIKYGVEPVKAMAAIAKNRGITVYEAYAENLPIDDNVFDFVLMVTVDCFLKDIEAAFKEVYRILKADGVCIIGMIDKETELGKKHENEKQSNKFYRDAHFHSTKELTEYLKQSGFQNFQYWQTLTKLNEEEIEKTEKGYGKGSFVVIKASKV